MNASIIIRAFNAEATIARALESALSQDLPKEAFEIIIVDDGSEDRTRAILSAYERDGRVRLIRQKNGGATQAANTGFHAARGRFVALLDDDDEYMPDFLSATVARLDADPSADFVCTDYFEEYRNVVRRVALSDLFQTIVDNTLYRKASLEAEGFWRADALFPEYDILLRTFGRWKGAHLSRPLVTYHRSKASISADREWVARALTQLSALHPERVVEISKIRSYALAQ